MLDQLEQAQVSTLVLSDKPPFPVNGVFVHGRSHSDYDEIFNQLAGLYRSGQIQDLVIPGTEGQRINDPTPGLAWPGKTKWIEELTALGISTKHIHLSGPTYHTRQDTNVFLDFALQAGWKTIAVGGLNPHQALRAMLGTVKALAERGLLTTIKTYALTPRPANWTRMVFGSQGAESKPRFAHIKDELIRIPLYQAKGDLASFQELIDYYLQRG